MKALLLAVMRLFGVRPDYSAPFTLDRDLPDESSVGPNGMIELVPGRTLTIEGGLEKLPTVVAEGPAGPNPFADMVLPATDKEVSENIPGEGFSPPPGQTTFTLWTKDEGPTFLQIENGYDIPVAHITYFVEPQGDGFILDPTVTRAVKARGASVELRHQAVRAAYIGGLRAAPDDEVCLDAATERMRRVRVR
jgi:hypothetical protein